MTKSLWVEWNLGSYYNIENDIVGNINTYLSYFFWANV